MPNRLEKLLLAVPPAGGGSGGSGGEAGGGSGGALPPPGSTCFASVEAKIRELWPFYTVVYVPENQLFRLASYGDDYVYNVTGTCSGGFVSLSYATVRTPGSGSDVVGIGYSA